MTEIQREARKAYQDMLEKKKVEQAERERSERGEIIVGAKQQFKTSLPDARLIETNEDEGVKFSFDGQIFDCGRGYSKHGDGLRFYLSQKLGDFGYIAKFANLAGYGHFLEEKAFYDRINKLSQITKDLDLANKKIARANNVS